MRHAIRDFAGDLVLPGDGAYEDARRTQDETVDRRPAVIARCSGPRDVIAALRFAREAGLAVRVRGGGHGPDRFAVDDDALVIDLSPMRAVQVDPVGRRVRVEGGATWREVDAATQAHGLAVTGARLPSVGVAGFTLGSGSGWLERKLGLAADCLHGARVVTADADMVAASEHEHPDLFWARRGGGPSFGIVAELEFALHPIDEVAANLVAWPLERAAAVTHVYAELMASAPDDLGGALALLNGAPFVPEPLRSAALVAILVVWTGRGDAPIASLAPYAPGDAWPNFIPERDPARLQAAYGADSWRRLQAIRASWDPDDVFSAGHAITLP